MSFISTIIQISHEIFELVICELNCISHNFIQIRTCFVCSPYIVDPIFEILDMKLTSHLKSTKSSCQISIIYIGNAYIYHKGIRHNDDVIFTLSYLQCHFLLILIFWKNLVSATDAVALTLCSPGHRLRWHWLCMTNGSLSSMRKDFNYFLAMDKWLKMWMLLQMSSVRKGAMHSCSILVPGVKQRTTH